LTKDSLDTSANHNTILTYTKLKRIKNTNLKRLKTRYINCLDRLVNRFSNDTILQQIQPKLQQSLAVNDSVTL
jgi:hypothetical protein